MSDEQEQHLEDIQDDFCDLVEHKYRAGQKEHGGFLGDLPAEQLLDNAIDEAIDQVVYLLTLKQKLQP